MSHTHRDATQRRKHKKTPCLRRTRGTEAQLPAFRLRVEGRRTGVRRATARPRRLRASMGVEEEMLEERQAWLEDGASFADDLGDARVAPRRSFSWRSWQSLGAQAGVLRWVDTTGKFLTTRTSRALPPKQM